MLGYTRSQPPTFFFIMHNHVRNYEGKTDPIDSIDRTAQHQLQLPTETNPLTHNNQWAAHKLFSCDEKCNGNVRNTTTRSCKWIKKKLQFDD